MDWSLFKRILSHLVVVLTIASPALARAQDALTMADAPVFKVGDSWKFRSQDVGNRRDPTWYANTVQSADEKEVLLYGEQGDRKFWWIYDVKSNKLLMRFNYDADVADKRGRKTADNSGNDARVQFPLQVGRKWPINEKFLSAQYGRLENDLKAVVTAVEKVKTEAGEFDAFKIEIEGRWNNRGSGNSGRYLETQWYAPSAKRVVKIEGKTFVQASVFDQWREELLEFKPGL